MRKVIVSPQVFDSVKEEGVRKFCGVDDPPVVGEELILSCILASPWGRIPLPKHDEVRIRVVSVAEGWIKFEVIS